MLQKTIFGAKYFLPTRGEIRAEGPDCPYRSKHKDNINFGRTEGARKNGVEKGTALVWREEL